MSAFDANGTPIPLNQNEIVIVKTAATVEVIPAPHTISLEVLRKFGGKPTLIHLVHAGEQLPKQGEVKVKAAVALEAGSFNSLNFRLWQGDIEDPVTDNRFIGTMKIFGKDFDHGSIPSGTDLVCEYKISEAAYLNIGVFVPSIDKIFMSAYSAEEGKIDYTSISARTRVADEVKELRKRIDESEKIVDDPRLEQIKQKLEAPAPHEEDAERWLDAHARVWEAKRFVANVRKEHPKDFRQFDLDRMVSSFDQIRRNVSKAEAAKFDKLTKTAQHAIDNDVDDFEEHLAELRQMDFDLHWRQDWFVIDIFNKLRASSPPDCSTDRERFENLVASGLQCLQKGINLNPPDDKVLRTVVIELYNLLYGDTPPIDDINIYRQ